MSKLLIVALFAFVAIAFAGAAPKKDEHKQNKLHKEGYFGGGKGDDDDGTKAHERELHGKEAHEAGAAKTKTTERLSSKYKQKQDEVPAKLAEHTRPTGIDHESAKDKVADKIGKFADYEKKVGDFSGKIGEYKGQTWGVGGFEEEAEEKYHGKAGEIGKLSGHGASASKQADAIEVDEHGGYQEKFHDKQDSYEVTTRKATPTYNTKGKEKEVRGDKESLPTQIIKKFHGIEKEKLQRKTPPNHADRLEELEERFHKIAAEARKEKEAGKHEKEGKGKEGKGKAGKGEKGKKGKSYQ